MEPSNQDNEMSNSADDEMSDASSLEEYGDSPIDPFLVDHSYLGEDMAVLGSKSAHFVPGSVVDMPLVVLPDLVIFPGETLPLRMLSTWTLQSMTSRLRHGNDVFAIINTERPRHVGTLIQIERVYEQGDMYLSIVGRGRQRFEFIERLHASHLVSEANARIRVLPDLHAIPCPFPTPGTTRRKRPRLTTIAYWGPAEYAQFDGPSLVHQAKAILLQSVEWQAFLDASFSSSPSAPLASSPSDPTRFSYWLAGHLTLSLRDRQRLLAMSCVVGRLRSLIAWLQQHTSLIQCAGCATTLADTRDIFLQQDVDDGGPVSTFVNPHGSIHQILTMQRVAHGTFWPHGEPTLADTWFPGYTWQCIYCRVCANFLGWRYVSTIEQVHPRVFYGLLRKAIN